MVINQSVGKFAPNTMIKREDIKGFPLDNMQHLGAGLLVRHHAASQSFVHNFQIRCRGSISPAPHAPIVATQTSSDLDRNNCFGGRGSADLWTYMDDSVGINESVNVIWYHRYGKRMLASQVKLLSLWDELGIPHESHKQVFGEKFTIIGIEVNANSLTLMFPRQGLDELLNKIESFAAWSKEKGENSQTLHRWQRLAGWLNWSFNVFPIVRPALNNFYLKITGKEKPLMKIWVNNAVHLDLHWALSTYKNLRESDCSPLSLGMPKMLMRWSSVMGA